MKLTLLPVAEPQPHRQETPAERKARRRGWFLDSLRRLRASRREKAKASTKLFRAESALALARSRVRSAQAELDQAEDDCVRHARGLECATESPEEMREFLLRYNRSRRSQ